MQVRLCSALVAVQGGSSADHSPLPETARARVCCRNGFVLRILQRNGRLITAAFSNRWHCGANDASPRRQDLPGSGQRSAAGLPPYPTDWTAALQIHDHDAVISSAEDVPDAQKTKKDVRAHKKSASGLVAVRDAVCWDSLAAGCTAPKGACTRLHPMHAGTPVCGRHATSLLGLWGRRQRPPCMGGCGKAHPSLGELKAALRAALPAGSRLHEHVQPPPPCLGRAESARNNGSGASAGGCDNGVGTGIHSLYVAPSDFEPAAINEALAAQAPMPLRVAIDVGFDEIMSEGERKSLATQCGLMHGIASQADVRQHVALAICCGTPSLKKNGAHAGAAATPPCIAVLRSACADAFSQPTA